ncbi:hypothetical protein FBG13_14900 [Cobetia marina]|jgi:hypothetical protein|uniref:Uncharacterized protein n=2 Tax=Cobetia TaxID=204286 RepID=A0ABU9GH13_COBMA|nr:MULTISPECIES: hypothetical protein [Cobetia]AOM00007.1 hypothetical protein BFX80_00080 [Cobetia marina]MDA5564059.1 hypothetical protein [Cobetia sp. MMG027]MDH2291672.1 hypothetical protein [Cobetia sp. 10Alg 146]MDH2374209.1 hypothetical protein [Cobetia sp. 3AK]MDI6004603.1 hypothetical protein [Cobetia pacifica]
MRNSEQVDTLKNELLDIFMTLGADEHQARKKQSAVRHLRARRGIEMHNEIKRLSEDLSDIEVLETESDIDTH